MLDLTGHYYSFSTLQEFINELAAKSNSYIELNLTNDIYVDSNDNWINSGVTVENSTIGQSGSALINSNGLSYLKSASTNKPACTKFPMITKAELQQIVSYAVLKKVQVIPLIDVPSHAEGLIAGASWSPNFNAKLYSDITLPSSDSRSWNTLNYSNPQALAFAEQVISEYLPIFSQQPNRVFAIGGDEIVGTSNESEANYPAFASFMNQLNRFVNANGFVRRMWNDAITTATAPSFDKNIQIAYWTSNGWCTSAMTDSSGDTAKKDIASAQTLLNDGYQLYNYNGYYLYFLPTSNLSADSTYTLNDITTKWNSDDFNQENTTNPVTMNTQNIMGSALSYWGGSLTYSNQQIYQSTQSLVTGYLNK